MEGRLFAKHLRGVSRSEDAIPADVSHMPCLRH